MPDLCIFRLEFENAIVIIEIKALKFADGKISCYNKNGKTWEQKCIVWEFFFIKFLNLGQKVSYLGVLGSIFEKQ